MPILRLKSKLPRIIQYPLKIQTDRRAGLLSHLIFNWQVEVIGAVVQSLQRVLILRQHRRSDPRDIVQVNPAQRKMPQILRRRNLDPPKLREVRLESPAEKTSQPIRLVLRRQKLVFPT